MKIFEIYPYWFIANSKKEAIEEFIKEFGEDEFNEAEEIKQLTQKDLDELKYYPDYEDDSGKHISFKQQLHSELKMNNKASRIFAINLTEM